jgi:hypothetical protein
MRANRSTSRSRKKQNGGRKPIANEKKAGVAAKQRSGLALENHPCVLRSGGLLLRRLSAPCAAAFFWGCRFRFGLRGHELNH